MTGQPTTPSPLPRTSSANPNNIPSTSTVATPRSRNTGLLVVGNATSNVVIVSAFSTLSPSRSKQILSNAHLHNFSTVSISIYTLCITLFVSFLRFLVQVMTLTICQRTCFYLFMIARSLQDHTRKFVCHAGYNHTLSEELPNSPGSNNEFCQGPCFPLQLWNVFTFILLSYSKLYNV